MQAKATVALIVCLAFIGIGIERSIDQDSIMPLAIGIAAAILLWRFR